MLQNHTGIKDPFEGGPKDLTITKYKFYIITNLWESNTFKVLAYCQRISYLPEKYNISPFQLHICVRQNFFQWFQPKVKQNKNIVTDWMKKHVGSRCAIKADI